MNRTTYRPQIRLIVVDNEGCFVPAKGEPIHLEPVLNIRAFLKEHRQVAFTFCTGRSVPYMEAIAQVAGLTESSVPLVCEGGGVFYWPSNDRFEILAHATVEREFLETLPVGTYRLEPGKLVCVSLYPEPPETVESLTQLLVDRLNRKKLNLAVSAAAIDITPRGVNKGSGLKALSTVTGISLENVLCVGDSSNDLSMLEVAGFTACPANASENVKKIVDYVSPLPYARGLLDILKHMITGQ